MAKLLMVTGDRALAEGKRGAFYNTIEEFHEHWDRIDIICPPIRHSSLEISHCFGNVFLHPSPWPLIFQPFWILKEGLKILKTNNYEPRTKNYLMTVHEYPPFYNGIGARLLWSRLFKEKSRILDSRSESGEKIGVPYILEIFHIPGYPEHSNIRELIYKSLVHIFISYDAFRAKAVRIMNTDVGNFLELSGVPSEKLILIPAIYVDLDIFKPITDYQLPITKQYDLIFIGRLESNKGVNLFLEAVKELNRKAIIVGDGPLHDWIQSQITNYQLPITMFGFAKDSREIAELLNKSKILVMPSYNEGGPRVVVEALACGVPVLATPVGIVPDLLKNGLGGEIIDWDAEDIAKKAGALLGDSDRYNKLSNMAIEMAKSFEKKAAIKNYADELKRVISKQ